MSGNRSRISPIGAHLGLKISPSQGRLSIRDLFESELLANGNTQVCNIISLLLMPNLVEHQATMQTGFSGHFMAYL